MKRWTPNSPELRAYFKTLPTCPGVYLVTCNDGSSYLGASKNLRQRVSQHLSRKGRFHGHRIDVVETMDEYDVMALRALEDKYLAAFNFEHNCMNASPYSDTSNPRYKSRKLVT